MATGFSTDHVQPPASESTDVWGEQGDIVAGMTTRGSSKAGYTLWMFDGTQWRLTKDQSAEGYLPGTPPSVPGRFKGQVRAVLAVKI